ncbi:MAG TPA: hypothetical protein VLH60_08145, partial [Sedimentisphaerales bacterium]|nr:hypothetical protein [Sedimentisphaerales bacterium]
MCRKLTIIAAALMLLAGSASGRDWIGVVSTSWHDSGNWSTGSPPTAGQNWTINANTPHQLIITDAFIGGVRTGILYARDGFTITATGSMNVGQLQHVSNPKFSPTLIQGTLDSAPGGSTPSFWRIGTWTIDGGIVRVNRRIEIGNTTSGTMTMNVINGGVLEQLGTEYFITGNNSGTTAHVNITGANSRVISHDGGSIPSRTWINRHNTSGRVTISNGGSWNMHITMADISSNHRGLTHLLANNWVRNTVSTEELVLTPNANRINVAARTRTWAGDPSPANGSTGWTYSPPLSWTPGIGALRSEVYFGTSQAAVATAQRLKADINADGVVDVSDMNEVALQWLETPAFPCPDLNADAFVNFLDFALTVGDFSNQASPLFLGSTTANTYDTNILMPNTTYHWRVDSMQCSELVPGPVWQFR